MNYNKKRFRTLHNSENGETSSDTVFEYTQVGNRLSSVYKGGDIVYGHLLGLVSSEGIIEMRYHQINSKGALMTGRCISTPELMENGKIRLHESWQWTSGDLSKGTSVLEEI